MDLGCKIVIIRSMGYTKNIDKCVESLGEIELKALVLYCKSADSTYLDIHIHYARDFDNDISEVPVDTPFTMS